MSEQREAVVRREVCRLVDDEEDELAAAVIRDYGDKRYQQAIADVVEWIDSGAGPYVEGYGEEIAQEITRRFGKDA